MFKISKDIKFTNFYKKMNIISFIVVCLSIVVLLFKGLNLGVDFKGGTLIEVRTESVKTNISEIRQSLLKMELGDVNVKKFGKENDYLIKIEITNTDDANFIKSINDQLTSDLGSVVNFRRVENVGPKDKLIASKPAFSNSPLTLGPAFSTRLKFTTDPKSDVN
jgi:preprotein translocase subunit SecF